MTECAGAQIHRGNRRNGKAIVQRAYDRRRLGRRRRSDGSNEVSDRRRDDKRLPRAWRIVADSLETRARLKPYCGGMHHDRVI